jgi:hypothetical protein
MPATAARIGFITQEWRRATVTDETIRDRYGHLARESEDPIETFFDSVDDAEAIAEARHALLAKERRRFQVALGSTDSLLPHTLGSQAPTVTYIDTERDANRPMLVAEITLDLARDRATATLWG